MPHCVILFKMSQCGNNCQEKIIAKYNNIHYAGVVKLPFG